MASAEFVEAAGVIKVRENFGRRCWAAMGAWP